MGMGFKLALSTNFGIDINVRVRPFLPKSMGIVLNIGLSHGDKSTEAIIFPSPPVTLDEGVSLSVRQSVLDWVNDAIDNRLDEWADFCYWGETPEAMWQREIMFSVCQFYQDLQKNPGYLPEVVHRTLRSVISLTMVNFLMDHALVVPDSDKLNLSRHLQALGADPDGSFAIEYLQEQIVSPRVAARHVKAQVLPLLKQIVDETLTGLTELFRLPDKKDKPNTYAAIFAVSFTLLDTIGQVQAAVVDKIIVAKTHQQYCEEYDNYGEKIDVSLHEARGMIPRIDEELTEFLKFLFSGKYKVISSKTFNPFTKDGCLAQLDPVSQRFIMDVREITMADYSKSYDNKPDFQAADIFFKVRFTNTLIMVGALALECLRSNSSMRLKIRTFVRGILLDSWHLLSFLDSSLEVEASTARW